MGLLSFDDDDDLISIAGANLMPIFIFFIVYGILIYHEDFPVALVLELRERIIINQL